MPKYLNIACGSVFSSQTEWLNLDYSPAKHVQGMNIVGDIHTVKPVFEVVYTSHFLEHVPLDLVPVFLRECRRLTADGGLFRVVVPDAEMLMREYLKHRDTGESAKADYAYLLFLDQCTRRFSGGQLGLTHQRIRQGDMANLQQYVHYLEGSETVMPVPTRIRPGLSARAFAIASNPAIFLKNLERRYTRMICAMLPRAFREQNVIFTSVGERHAWMYDFSSLREKLIQAGFSSVELHAFNTTSRATGFFAPLDEVLGSPRKGHHQLFVEAHP